MAEPPPFAYDPLPAGSIRLLTPVSSEAADGYTWKLQTVALDQENLGFDALSYVWGSASELLKISLNGCVAQVHRNLFTALPYLARRGDVRPVRPIWIDAICINQVDHEEKMVQIREMNRVYKQAKKVWIWLGTTKYQNRIADALRFLEHLAEYKSSHPDDSTDDMEKRLDLENVDIPIKLALYHIVHNDWFGRLWVIQEAALAQEISFLCGDDECSWALTHSTLRDDRLCMSLFADFQRCGPMLDSYDPYARYVSWMNNGKGKIFYIRDIVKRRRGAKDHEAAGSQALMLAMTLMMSRQHECLRREDRVLGLLGLVDSKFLERTCLDADIAHVSVEELFTRTTRFILDTARQTDNYFLWMFLRWAFEPSFHRGLPSWVPDLSNPGNQILEYTEPDYTRPSRYADFKKPCYLRDCLEPKQLVLKGKVVDEVTTVFARMPFSSSLGLPASQPEKREYLITVLEWEEKIADAVLKRTSLGSETWPQKRDEDYKTPKAYWQTLVNRQERKDMITYGWYLDFRALSGGLRKMTTCTTTQESVVDTSYPQPNSPVADRAEIVSMEDRYPNAYKFADAMKAVDYKQLFKTRKGHFSTTSWGAQPDDILVALNGAPILHVIRKVTSATDHEPEVWKFVGEAFVHSPNCENDEDSTPEESNVEEYHVEQDTLGESNTDEPDCDEREFVFV